jgi:glycosyltransferase involved in cell wall biosynthesis
VTAALFGTFNARHAANALLAGDLRRAGIEVRLCHEPLWEETRDKDASYFGAASLLRLGARYARLVPRLVRRFRDVAADADVLIAGFNGQLDVLLLRRLAGTRPIVFVPLVTVTETLVDDRHRFRDGSPPARLAALLDRASLAAADLVVLDTAAHLDWVARRFAVPRDRMAVHHLGAEAAFAASEVRDGERGSPQGRPADGASSTGRPAEGTSSRDCPAAGRRLRVLFYGQYLPLHGADVIARAARLLGPDAGVEIEFVGTGPERAACDRLTAGLAHVKRTDWVPYDALPRRIAGADVVLGIFGTSQKARFVIPNKVYQAAQVGRPIVTADTPAVREVFAPGESIVAIPPDPPSLARALAGLARDPVLRRRLGDGARHAVETAAAAEVRSARIAAALEAVVARVRRDPGVPGNAPHGAAAGRA